MQLFGFIDVYREIGVTLLQRKESVRRIDGESCVPVMELHDATRTIDHKLLTSCVWTSASAAAAAAAAVVVRAVGLDKKRCLLIDLKIVGQPGFLFVDQFRCRVDRIEIVGVVPSKSCS